MIRPSWRRADCWQTRWDSVSDLHNGNWKLAFVRKWRVWLLTHSGLLSSFLRVSGKTLQVLSLIATSLRQNVPSSDASSNKLTLKLKRPGAPTGRGGGAPTTPTLIVCPLSVITNWEQQVLHHFHPAQCLTVYTYHGTNRTRDVQQLKGYDLIITTYNILSQEVRHMPIRTQHTSRHLSHAI